MRTCSHCKQPYQPVNPRQRYCSTPCRDRKLGRRPRVKAKSTTEAGYGYAHKKERARWKPLVDAGQVDCWRCGRWIPPHTPWQLGHDDHDRSIYRGPEHRRCNTSAGAAQGNRQRVRRYTSSAPRVAHQPDTAVEPRVVRRTCRVCSTPYPVAHPGQRTCGPACGRVLNQRQLGAVEQAARQIWHRVCIECHRPYPQGDPRRRLCGPACSRRRVLRRAAERYRCDPEFRSRVMAAAAASHRRRKGEKF